MLLSVTLWTSETTTNAPTMFCLLTLRTWWNYFPVRLQQCLCDSVQASGLLHLWPAVGVPDPGVERWGVSEVSAAESGQRHRVRLHAWSAQNDALTCRSCQQHQMQTPTSNCGNSTKKHWYMTAHGSALLPEHVNADKSNVERVKVLAIQLVVVNENQNYLTPVRQHTSTAFIGSGGIYLSCSFLEH